ncbi:hypothetical protein GCM10027605_44460 [Micromonospora zhanjiangensis]
MGLRSSPGHPHTTSIGAYTWLSHEFGEPSRDGWGTGFVREPDGGARRGGGDRVPVPSSAAAMPAWCSFPAATIRDVGPGSGVDHETLRNSVAQPRQEPVQQGGSRHGGTIR